MKIFHRITIALSEEENSLLEDLRKETGDSLSQIFRDALQIYYRIIKAGKKVGIDYRKYLSDVERLASHIYGVETAQFVIIDREFYRVLLKKLQERFSEKDLESDPEMLNAIRGVAMLFLHKYNWKEDDDATKKVEEVLKTFEFAGGGRISKIGEGKFVVQTPPENLTITKTILKMLFDAMNVISELETSEERIFVKVLQ
ncbi:MAG: hypothetical protein PWQ58_462 [Archaeoglobaceae archaeon]|nr:hypothetical protein [Archaeoglobaceae archaeon]